MKTKEIVKNTPRELPNTTHTEEVNLIESNFNTKEKLEHTEEPIASYLLPNNNSLIVFDIDYFENAILAGTSIDDAKWYLIQDSKFFYGEAPFYQTIL